MVVEIVAGCSGGEGGRLGRGRRGRIGVIGRVEVVLEVGVVVGVAAAMNRRGRRYSRLLLGFGIVVIVAAAGIGEVEGPEVDVVVAAAAVEVHCLSRQLGVRRLDIAVAGWMFAEGWKIDL